VVVAAAVLVALLRRRQRLRRLLDSLAGTLSGPRHEAIDLPIRAEATGTFEGRPTRIRLEILGALLKLSVGVECRASGTFSITRHDAREIDAHSSFVPPARALIQRHHLVSVSLDAVQLGIPLDQQPYRLEVVLDLSKRPDLDPGRICAVVRDASALASLCETR
jgi:hypothetical protein